MSQLTKKNILDNAVGAAKVRLENNTALRARNAADSADVSILKVNASDQVDFLGNVLKNLGAPVAGGDAVTLSYLTTAFQGLKPKQAVVVASTANVNLASASSPLPIDGVTLANGDRVLLKDQTAPEENGIYVAVTATDPTTWTRALDFDNVSEIPGSYTVSEFGTVAQGVLYVCLSTPAVLDVDPITFAKRSIATYTADESTLHLSGTQFSIKAGGVTNTEVSASAAIAYSKLNLSASIVNADINASAAIAYSKLNLSGSIVNADINASAAIAYSKLALTGSIVNADISASAAIAYSKLNLSGAIVNADVATGAAIARSKLASGTNNYVVINNGSGVLSEEQFLSVTRGGTGLGTLTANNVILGNGTSTPTFVAPGSSGNVLTSNGSTWTSAAPSASSTWISEQLTLNGTDISNGYKDLGHVALSATGIELTVLGGLLQNRGVDYTVSLTGGSGGVTRITFAGDLASGGAAALVSGDILAVGYEY